MLLAVMLLMQNKPPMRILFQINAESKQELQDIS
jgi:hypothetical protein